MKDTENIEIYLIKRPNETLKFAKINSIDKRKENAL